MELRHLRYFVAAAEEQHFSRAAEKLHVTRPAVSQIVSDLEGELGTALFVRRAHRLELTTAGSNFLFRARAVLADLNVAVDIARSAGRGELGSVSVGYGSLALLYPVLWGAIKAFGSGSPKVALELLEMNSRAQFEAIRSGRLHAGFCYSPRREHEDLDGLHIHTASLVLALPLHHPLASKRQIAPADIVEERFVELNKGGSGSQYAEPLSRLRAEGVGTQVVQEVRSATALLSFVAAGVGVAFIPAAADLKVAAGVALRPVTGLRHRLNFELVWSRQRTDPALARFVETVRAVLAAGQATRHAAAVRRQGHKSQA